VDAVLESGVTQDFRLRRRGEAGRVPSGWRSFLDEPGRRRVALEPDYFGFRPASNHVWVGYGFATPNGTGRNYKQLSSGTNNSPRKSGKGRKKKA